MKFTFSPNIALNVRDLNDASRFYREVLGMEALPVDNPAEGVPIKFGPLTLWLDEAPNPERVGMTFFEFLVEDLEKSTTTLEKQGCRRTSETGGTNFTGRMMRDSYGMQFHLYCRKS